MITNTNLFSAYMTELTKLAATAKAPAVKHHKRRYRDNDLPADAYKLKAKTLRTQAKAMKLEAAMLHPGLVRRLLKIYKNGPRVEARLARLKAEGALLQNDLDRQLLMKNHYNKLSRIDSKYNSTP